MRFKVLKVKSNFDLYETFFLVKKGHISLFIF